MLYLLATRGNRSHTSETSLHVFTYNLSIAAPSNKDDSQAAGLSHVSERITLIKSAGYVQAARRKTRLRATILYSQGAPDFSLRKCDLRLLIVAIYFDSGQ